ncbi:hypothetical protein SK128_023585 [Halocaridina rubra]|uniref:Phosphatidic acid phosphatase type 2/haloperoxidase domain-containing protein n=1 Tax=Halocaridina rubra TaxID=373956 RepID=A0AAN8X0Z2_HALRR
MKGEKYGSKKVVTVAKGKNGGNVAKVTNHLLVPLVIIEALLTAGVCALNYLLRYDPDVREDCSMINWEGVNLWCTDIQWLAKPVYNNTNSITNSVTFELPEWVFFTCAIVVSSSIVIIVEILKSFTPAKKIKTVVIAGMKLKPVFRRIPRYICNFMMGGAAVGALVSVLKLLIASPRPHFLEICSPNSTLADSCTGGFTWSPLAVCEGDPIEVHEALRAFPSYHATLAVYSGVWTIVYLSRAARLPGIYSAMLVVIGAVLAMTSIGTSHYYFTSESSSADLLAGGIIGAIAALYVTLVTLNGFRERPFKIKIVRGQSGKQDHPNMLPIKPLQGSFSTYIMPSETRAYGDSVDDDSKDDDDDSDKEEYEFLAMMPESFPYLPRVTPSRETKSPTSKRTLPAQAINSRVGTSVPIPPPMPRTTNATVGPPPSYTRNQHLSAYNVPRQR